MENLAEENRNNWIKYPRTFHLPYSPGTTNDDKKLADDSMFVGKEVIITEKLDGENTSMTYDRVWARSVDSKDHPSRNWINQFWNTLKYDIPTDIRICGENVYAKHSIMYDKLSTYFYVFSIWRERECLSWSETLEWCELLGLKTVPVIYEGVYDADFIRKAYLEQSLFGNVREGLVVRVPEGFSYEEFPNKLSKIVRQGHVQTSKHWMKEAVVPNIVIYGE